MPGWGKLVAGVVLGAAGAVYATNEELRKRLPEGARDLPVAVRRRFEAARSAAREASRTRRAEILRDLEAHGAEPREPRGVEAPGGADPGEHALPTPPRDRRPELPPDEAPPEALLDAGEPIGGAGRDGRNERPGPAERTEEV